MFRTVLYSRRKYLAFGLVVVLVLGAAAFFFTRQGSVPVTGGAQAVRVSAAGLNGNTAPDQNQANKSADGKWVTTLPNGLQILVPEPGLNKKPDPNKSQADNQGQVYRLETNAQGVRVVASDRVVAPDDKTFDLGEGYRLLVTASGGEIIPPAGSGTSDRQVDLGEDYVLSISGGYARVLLPNGPIRPEPHDPSVHTDPIGGGFWLVTGSDGALIFQEATK